MKILGVDGIRFVVACFPLHSMANGGKSLQVAFEDDQKQNICLISSNEVQRAPRRIVQPPIVEKMNYINPVVENWFCIVLQIV